MKAFKIKDYTNPQNNPHFHQLDGDISDALICIILKKVKPMIGEAMVMNM